MAYWNTKYGLKIYIASRLSLSISLWVYSIVVTASPQQSTQYRHSNSSIVVILREICTFRLWCLDGRHPYLQYIIEIAIVSPIECAFSSLPKNTELKITTYKSTYQILSIVLMPNEIRQWIYDFEPMELSSAAVGFSFYPPPSLLFMAHIFTYSILDACHISVTRIIIMKYCGCV